MNPKIDFDLESYPLLSRFTPQSDSVIGQQLRVGVWYNPEVKQDFLYSVYKGENDPNNYAKSCSVVLRKVGDFEALYDKDLYQFDYQEIISMLRAFSIRSRESLNVHHSIIVGYIDFCIKSGYKPENEMNLARYNVTSEDLEGLVSVRAVDRRYIYGTEEYENLLGQWINAQDEVIFALLWEGIKGKEFSEIRELKIDDVDEDNNRLLIRRVYSIPVDDYTHQDDDEQISTYRDKNGVQTIDVRRPVWFDISPKSMLSVVGAIHQEQYYSVNLSGGSDAENYTVKNLDMNDYVVRTSGKNKGNEPVAVGLIQRRIKSVGVNVDKEGINATTVYHSGASSYVNRLIELQGKLEPDTSDFKEACARFGLNPESSWFKIKTIWKLINSAEGEA